MRLKQENRLKCFGVVRDVLHRAGISVMCLPPYSPDLNPIEQAFAKLKTLLQRARARTRDDLLNTIGSIMDRFDPAECRRYVRHAGYVRS
ncbi:MAG: transposase [Pseudomonadota bacterium]